MCNSHLKVKINLWAKGGGDYLPFRLLEMQLNTRPLDEVHICLTFKSSWSRSNASEICVYRDVQISSLLVETFMKWCSIQIWITIQKTDSEASVHRLWMAWSHELGIAGYTTFFIGGTSGKPVQAFLGHLTLEESRIMQRRSANLLDGTRTFHIITYLPYL